MYRYEQQQQYNKPRNPAASSGAGMKAVKELTGGVQSQQSGKTIRPVSIYFLQFLLTLLGPQSRFGDKLLIFRVNCPHIWECGSKRVNASYREVAVIFYAED